MPRTAGAERRYRMNSNQYANKDNRVRFLIMLISVATVLLVVCLLILVIHNVSGSGTKSNGTDNQDEKNFKINYTTITKATSDVKTGNLVLVNGSHAFTFPEKEEGLISMYTYRQNNPVPKLNGSGSVYQLADTSIRLREPAASQIHNMLVKFYEHSGNTNVNITSAYRTYDEQKNLASSIAAGYSDSHTGLACALRTYDGQKAGELKGDLATYGWIFDHCYEFGFIVRYPDGHDAHTGISNYTNYFRYVGYPHAWYMTHGTAGSGSAQTEAQTTTTGTQTPAAQEPVSGSQTAIYCLEDYLTLLKQYPYSGKHLRFKADNGITYEIYYVPASTGKELTEIPVPQDSTYTYEISGDNDSGFIVTVTLG